MAQKATRVKAADRRPPIFAGDPSPDAGPVTRTVELTPTKAQELLDREWSAKTSDGIELIQRPLNPRKVEEFAGIIERGKFRHTFQGLAVGANGSLYDGQHRCAAVVRTGIAVTVDVHYNVDPDDIEALDGGLPRRAYTKLGMRGFGNPTTLASAVRFLHTYLRYEEDPDSVPDWRSWPNISVGDDEVTALIDAHPELADDVTWAMSNRQATGGLFPAAVAAFRYLARRGWPRKSADLDGFLDAAVLHFGLTRGHPAQAVRKWVERTGGDRDRRYRREAQVYVLLTAWQAHLAGETVRGINDRLAGPFPLAQPQRGRR
jgi:hypothetical protein